MGAATARVARRVRTHAVRDDGAVGARRRRRSGAGAGQGAGAWRVLGQGIAHPASERRGKATGRRRDGSGRRRTASSAEEALRKGREPDKKGNGSRTTWGCFPCEESTRSSLEWANRWRPTELLAAASMAARRRGLDSGRENAGASSRRLEEVESEVRGPSARGIKERRPELVGAAMGASSARVPGGGRWGGEGEHGSGEG